MKPSAPENFDLSDEPITGYPFDAERDVPPDTRVDFELTFGRLMLRPIATAVPDPRQGTEREEVEHRAKLLEIAKAQIIS